MSETAAVPIGMGAVPAVLAGVRFLVRIPGTALSRAVSAVAPCRFGPGRLAGPPLDVLVTVMLDFTVR